MVFGGHLDGDHDTVGTHIMKLWQDIRKWLLERLFVPELKRGFSWQDGHRPVLLVARLCDMHRVRPADNSRVCERCGFRVGIYPSGQDMLEEHPGCAYLMLRLWPS